jgi:hypothetical protein
MSGDPLRLRRLPPPAGRNPDDDLAGYHTDFLPDAVPPGMTFEQVDEARRLAEAEDGPGTRRRILMQGNRNTGRIRTKVPGIYYRETESGERRYSFTYRDSGGRQHWRTVDGGLDEAKAAQARMVVRKGR